MSEKMKTVDEFFNNSKKLIGLPVHNAGVPPEWMGVGRTIAAPYFINDFANAIGDDNPLYTDPTYAAKAKYGCQIAHPHWISSPRYTICRGAQSWGYYPISGLVAGFDWEWNDVIRVYDKFKTSLVLEDVFQKTGRTGKLVFTRTLAKYWNQHREQAATGHGHWIGVGKDEAAEASAKGEGFRSSMIYERGTYHYSEDEIQKITDGIDCEKRRGDMPLYWEEVNVGDKVTPIVKGPLTTLDLMSFQARGGPYPAFELQYRSFVESGASKRVNTLTGWPYEAIVMEHYDWNLCKSRGLPAPFDVGCFRACAASHLLSNWMGDDGFIRRVYVQFRKPNFYGDTTFMDAEVVRKYRDKVGDEEYGAVDLRIMGMNQIGETSAPGTATVYLPSAGEPITLPIPHEDKFEDYGEYVKQCEELKANPIKF